jgi:hypothetical protein
MNTDAGEKVAFMYLCYFHDQEGMELQWAM